VGGGMEKKRKELRKETDDERYLKNPTRRGTQVAKGSRL
jgi:hypothetical protein